MNLPSIIPAMFVSRRRLSRVNFYLCISMALILCINDVSGLPLQRGKKWRKLFHQTKRVNVTLESLKEITRYPYRPLNPTDDDDKSLNGNRGGTIEFSLFKSGRYKTGVTIKDLSRVEAFPSILEFNEQDSKSHYMSKNCKSKLLKLAELTSQIWKGLCILYVQRSFVEEKTSSTLRGRTLHHNGRAIDVRLVKTSKNDGKYECNTSQKRMAYVAAEYAKFDYVDLHRAHTQMPHVHVSCKK